VSDAPAFLNLDEIEPLARERLSRPVYDYFAGGSDDEVTVRENREAFRRIRLVPRVLVDVTSRDLTTTLLGEALSSPLLVAPMALQRMADPEGEKATARAAAAAGALFVLSTVSSVSLEEVASAAPTAPRWFQLYHLTDRADRIRAFEEARRVARPGAPVVAAGISRFASLLDGLVQGRLGDPAFVEIVESDLATGQHRNPTDRAGWFTTAYFHRPEELAEEARDGGLVVDGVFGVEGPGWLLPDLWDNPGRREQTLRAARAVERDPSMLGLSAHLLVVARTP